MIIKDELVEFCIEKTLLITAAYAKSCIYPEDQETGGFPRSVDDLQWLVMGETGHVIWNHELQLDKDAAKFYSFYLHRGNDCHIFFAPQGMGIRGTRYLRTKESMQILFARPDLATVDIVDLVHKSIVADSPEGKLADLGPVVTADALGDVAACEFLFPYEERVKYADADMEFIGKRYGIPDFIIQRCFNNMEISKEFFERKNGNTV